MSENEERPLTEAETRGLEQFFGEFEAKYKQWDDHDKAQETTETLEDYERLGDEIEAAEGQAQYEGDIKTEMIRLVAEAGQSTDDLCLPPFAYTLRGIAKLSLHGLEPNHASEALAAGKFRYVRSGRLYYGKTVKGMVNVVLCPIVPQSLKGRANATIITAWVSE